MSLDVVTAVTRGEGVFHTLAIDKIHAALNCLACSDKKGEVDPRGFDIGVDQMCWAQLGGRNIDSDLTLVGNIWGWERERGDTGLLSDTRFRVVLVEGLPKGSICFIWKNL